MIFHAASHRLHIFVVIRISLACYIDFTPRLKLDYGTDLRVSSVFGTKAGKVISFAAPAPPKVNQDLTSIVSSKKS